MSAIINDMTRSARDSGFALIVEQVTARLQAGDKIDLNDFAAEHPDQIDRLRDLLPALQLLADASRPDGPPLILSIGADGTTSEPLGDFRLIREVGRGGMGIVYEAEQLSLNRNVALKVLPFAATMDPRHLQRFRNEAQAAACLHHPNIVPVYGVGSDRGVHYYAMQLIEGQTLAEVIAASRERERPESPGRASQRERDVDYGLEEEHVALTPRRSPSTAPNALLSTKRDRAHFRHIATLIASAADALEYAHSMGVVHRDVKPGNMMIDFSPLPASGRGDGGEGCQLWITDFGLAKLANPAREAGGELTMTGDLLGTLRYMSPEQALAKHGLVDHRTDIYSLGATLYELLTLQPAVAGADKGEILKAIAWDEPTPLRKHDKSIPAELETITLKCLAKEPGERYAAAGEVAEDLRRWLGDRAIKAKPPGWRENVFKWMRRHTALVRSLVAIGAIGSLAVVALLTLAWHKNRLLKSAYDQANTDRQNAIDNATYAQQMERATGEKHNEVLALNNSLQRTLYAAHMNLAKYAWDAGAVEQVDEFLDKHGPNSASATLRGFEWHHLHRASHAEMLTLKGHSERVRGVVYSPDGKRIASSSYRMDPAAPSTVKIWDAFTGRDLLTLGHTGIIGIMEFSQDSQSLAIASLNGTVKTWDLQTGQVVATHETPWKLVQAVAFSPDGQRLVAVSGEFGKDSQLEVWNVRTNKNYYSFSPGPGKTYNVAFSPDGKQMACTHDQRFEVWDVESGQKLESTKSSSANSRTPWSPNVLFWIEHGRPPNEDRVTVTNLQTDQQQVIVHGHRGTLTSTSFSWDGQHLATAASDRTIKMWDVRSGRLLSVLKGQCSDISRMAYSPDAKRLATVTVNNNEVKIWDTLLNQEGLLLEGHTKWIRGLAFDPDGKNLASISDDGFVKVWNTVTGQETLKFHAVKIPHVYGFALSPDGGRIATNVALDGSIKVWDATAGNELLTLKGTPGQGTFRRGPFRSIDFSPDGKRIAAASAGRVMVWDAISGREIITIKHPESFFSVAFTPDGQRLATNHSPQHSVRFWDAATGVELLMLPVPATDVNYPCRLALSKDGRHLASGIDYTVNVWDARNGQVLHNLKGHTAAVNGLAFSPDGIRLVTASSGQVKIWNLETGQELATFREFGHRVAFSPDGSRLASGASNGKIMIWDSAPLTPK